MPTLRGQKRSNKIRADVRPELLFFKPQPVFECSIQPQNAVLRYSTAHAISVGKKLPVRVLVEMNAAGSQLDVDD
jgi:hypothetical protein